MKHREIINKKTGEKLIMFQEGDFEFVQPVKYYCNAFILKQMIKRGVPKEELNGNKKHSEGSKQIFIEAVGHWKEMLDNFKSIKVPENLLKLLITNNKSEQETLLKGLVVTPNLFMALLIKAEELGFTLSQYTSEYSQKGLDLTKMPFAYEVLEDDQVKVFGKTELSVAQLRQAIEHRKVKIAKFLDKGDVWHCFFTTYKSIRGEETWLGVNQPHYHYISNSFGINRVEVVRQMKSEKYKLGNLPHIKLEDYGKQPK